MQLPVLLLTAANVFFAGALTTSDCNILVQSDLGSNVTSTASGLILAALTFSRHGISGVDDVLLMDHNIVCLAQGSVQHRYRMVSVVATYTINGESSVMLNQFHFQCSNNVWGFRVLGDFDASISATSMIGSLSTPVRKDCRVCADTIAGFSPQQHCVACSSTCFGLGRCSDIDGNNCCNYFGVDGACLSECTNNSRNNSNFQCICDSGFSANGSECVNIDDCLPNPCQNGGNCTDLITDYSCTCVPGFTDRNCSTNIDECSSNPCQNGGNCTDLTGDYSCICVPGFTDRNCSINIDDCLSNPCQNGGNCTDLIGDYDCTCVPGFTDKNCSTNIDDCLPNPCQNGGNCTDLTEDYSCTCVPGFTDRNCSTNIDECLSNPCQNRGNCTDLTGDYSCICVPGFTDRNCSTNINDCLPNPCQNGGNCTDLTGDYSCTCVPGFTDRNCVTNIDECLSNPCQNGGNCTDLVGDYMCTCAVGYSGGNCSTLIDNCFPNPCHNGGTCANRVGGFDCTCLEHWVGSACEMCNISLCTECELNSANRTSCVSCVPNYSWDASAEKCQQSLLPTTKCILNGCQRCSEEGKCLQCHESFSLSADSQCSAASSGNSGSRVAIISGAVVGVVLVLAVGAAVVCIMMWLCVWPMKKRSKVQVIKPS